MTVRPQLDRDGLPEDAIQLAAEALCRMERANDGSCLCARGKSCRSDEYVERGRAAVAGIRVGIREINGR